MDRDPRMGPASEGDVVGFHVVAYNANGTAIVDTRRPGGLPAPAPGANTYNYFTNEDVPPLRARLDLPAIAIHSKLPDAVFDVRRYLVGSKAGDVIHTPTYFAPLGEKPVTNLAIPIGPIAATGSYNLSNLYSEENLTESAIRFGDRSTWFVGRTVPFDGAVGATVTRIDGQVAYVKIEIHGGEVVHSRALGLDVTLTVDEQSGGVFLHPMASVGVRFETQGCSLPGHVLFPGSYTVLAVESNHIVLNQDVGGAIALYRGNVRFEIHVESVERGWN